MPHPSHTARCACGADLLTPEEVREHFGFRTRQAMHEAVNAGTLSLPEPALETGTTRLWCASTLEGVERTKKRVGRPAKRTTTQTRLTQHRLDSWLAALGLIRALSQADDRTRTQWTSGTLEIESKLDHEQISDFVLDKWAPSPVVSPWNSDTGLLPEDYKQRTSEELVDEFLAVNRVRLRPFQDALRAGRRIVVDGLEAGVFEPKGKAVKPVDKQAAIEFSRDRLPDDALAWVDACVTLTGDGKLKFAPLLGTGGNFGRIEMSVWHLRHLLRTLPVPHGMARARSEELLRFALFAEGDEPQLVNAPVTPHGHHEGFVNPWASILMVEGLLSLRASATNRLGLNPGPPFSVAFSQAGLPGSNPLGNVDFDAKGEFWAPVWGDWLEADELGVLLSDGRFWWGGRPAVDGVDVARAVASGSAPRQFSGFERWGVDARGGPKPIGVSGGFFPNFPQQPGPALVIP